MHLTHPHGAGNYFCGAMFGKFKDLFGKKEVILDPIDLGNLQADVHSHFIPGIDDGAKDEADSISLLSGMSALGYKKVITTPHVMSDYYRNTPEIIHRGLDQLRNIASREGINLEIEAAAEYYLDADLMQKIKDKELLTFGDNYVLFELPFISEPPNVSEIIFEMQLAGYKPVLAHPERYGFWHMSFDKYETMNDKGVILQLNINSLTGHYGPEVKKISQRLISEGMIGLLGSDCHHVGHLQLMEKAATLKPLHDLINSGNLLNSNL